MEFGTAFTFIADNPHLMWEKTLQLLEVSAISLVIAVFLGLVVGIPLGHVHRFSLLAINISNVGRALPSLGVLSIMLTLVGIGQTGIVVALVILGFPPILTNSYVAIDQVDAEVVDAARGIGLRPLQVLANVELPLALPLIFAGIRTSAVFIVATATLGGVFGGGGLGDILNNRESYGLQGIIASCYVLIVAAFCVQGLFLLVERWVTPRGLRLSRRGRLGGQQAAILTQSGGAGISAEDAADPELVTSGRGE